MRLTHLVAVLAPDLAANAVCPEVVAEGVSVGVGLVAHVALGLLALVSRLVNTGS